MKSSCLHRYAKWYYFSDTRKDIILNIYKMWPCRCHHDHLLLKIGENENFL